MGLLCLKMTLDVKKPVAVNTTSSSQKVFDKMFSASFLPFKYEITPDGHLNHVINIEGFSRSLDWSFTIFYALTLTRTLCILLDPLGEKNDEKEDSTEGDEVIENIEMNENKEALITENLNLELGRPEERKEISMEQATSIKFRFGIKL